MPIRAFVTQSIPQLLNTAAALEKAMQNGSLQELRVSGIVSRTGPIPQRDLELRYKQARYELYLRTLALDDADTNKANNLLLYTNPYQEKIMRVHSRSSVGVFGYPLPAPDVPPVP